MNIQELCNIFGITDLTWNHWDKVSQTTFYMGTRDGIRVLVEHYKDQSVYVGLSYLGKAVHKGIGDGR